MWHCKAYQVVYPLTVPKLKSPLVENKPLPMCVVFLERNTVPACTKTRNFYYLSFDMHHKPIPHGCFPRVVGS